MVRDKWLLLIQFDFLVIVVADGFLGRFCGAHLLMQKDKSKTLSIWFVLSFKTIFEGIVVLKMQYHSVIVISRVVVEKFWWEQNYVVILISATFSDWKNEEYWERLVGVLYQEDWWAESCHWKASPKNFVLWTFT